MIKLNRKVAFLMVVDTHAPAHIIFEGPWEQFEDVVYHNDLFTQRDVDVLLYAISMTHLAMPAIAFDLSEVDSRVRGLVITACRATYPNFTGRFSSKQITEWGDVTGDPKDSVNVALQNAVDRAERQGLLVHDIETRADRIKKTYCYYGNRPDLLDEEDGYVISLTEEMLLRNQSGQVTGYTISNPYSHKAESQYATGTVPLVFGVVDAETKTIFQNSEIKENK